MAVSKTESLVPLSNISALGCLIALVLWFATTGLPGIMEKWEKHSDSTRDDFKEVVDAMMEESRAQRTDFRAEMKEQRKQAFELATSGHNAVNSLSEQILDLHKSVKKWEPKTDAK